MADNRPLTPKEARDWLHEIQRTFPGRAGPLREGSR